MRGHTNARIRRFRHVSPADPGRSYSETLAAGAMETRLELESSLLHRLTASEGAHEDEVQFSVLRSRPWARLKETGSGSALRLFKRLRRPLLRRCSKVSRRSCSRTAPRTRSSMPSSLYVTEPRESVLKSTGHARRQTQACHSSSAIGRSQARAGCERFRLL